MTFLDIAMPYPEKVETIINTTEQATSYFPYIIIGSIIVILAIVVFVKLKNKIQQDGNNIEESNDKTE